MTTFLLNNSGSIIFALCLLVCVLHCVVCIRCRRNRGGGATPGLAAISGGEGREPGLSQPAIDALPSFAYHPDKCAAAARDCAVCLSLVEEGDMVRLLPDCGHAFHVACIDVWLHAHPLCPLCRAAAKPPEGKVEAGGGGNLLAQADAV